MAGIDISSARLVPGAGDEGWLCRLPSAVVWAPGRGDGATELVSACLAAASAPELLGRVGSHLADPQGAAWPPFAIVAERGAELVAVVHGPVELLVQLGSTEERLFGGDDVGSWLNRLLRNVSSVRAGAPVAADPLSDLRKGVVRASGFVLAATGAPVPAGGGPSGGTGAPAGRALAASVAPMAGAGDASARPFADDEFADGLMGGDFDAESPTVVEQPAVAAGGRGAPVLVGKLTWDNGDVHELSGPVLVGRDVAADEAVLAGRLAGVVPSGQNDSMSRVHAEMSIRAGEVMVTDRGSTNGTFIWDDGAKAWQRLAPGQARVVAPGTVLAFGERTATFEGSGAAAGS